MRIVSQDQWKPSDGIQLEQAAEEAVRETKNILVVAGPGAGKTELLAQKAGYLFSTNNCAYPQKILAISFKNDAADNLKKRVVHRYGKEIEGRFVSVTYDAFAKSILDRFRLALPEGNVPNADYLVNDDAIIEAAFNEAGYVAPFGQKASQIKAYFENTIDEVTLPLCGNSLGVRVWKNLLSGFREYKSCLSFKMISKLAIYIIQSNKRLRKALRLTYSHVFLDEFQDTTSLQYELVKTCFWGSDCQVTAVGDNKQRIMLWAGARRTIFYDYYREFDAKENRLLMNHRSAPRLVSLQKAMYDSLKDVDGQVVSSDKWKPEDGDISLLISDNSKTEAKWLAANIKRKYAEGVQLNDMCILCKQKPQDYTTSLIHELMAIGLRARIENDYQDLLKEPIVVLLLTVFKLAVNNKHPEEWEFIVNETIKLKGIDCETKQGENYYKLVDSLFAEVEAIGEVLGTIHSIGELTMVVRKAIRFWGIDCIKAYYPAYGQGNYLEDRIKQYIDLLWAEVTEESIDWENVIERFEGNKSIPIMTIHKSKGLEYDSVFFAGLEDSAFWNFKNQPEEDRCAFFVALSRARKSVTFTFCNYREGMRYPQQQWYKINEFFTLLRQPGMADIVQVTADMV